MRKAIYTLLLMALSYFAVGQSEIPASGPREENIVVGAIGGAVDVTTLGGASYTIPIEVPEGIGGMQPALSIVYNSQGGNGLLGWGWNLGGISAITRVGQTLYHDNNLKGVDFNNDRFALDGQRLMVVNGLPDGADGTEYRTEIDQMAKIVSYSCDTTFGPAYFKVWYSNGNIAYYGSKRHSRIGLQQRNDVCLWLLDSVVDRDNNYISYRYCRGGADYFLTDILYTGNNKSGVFPLYRVKLEYDTRPDEETVFIGNNTLHYSKILKRVTVSNTTEIRGKQLGKYEFAYTGGYGSELYKKLETVTFSGGGEKYKSTTINWGTDTNQYSYTQEGFSHTGDGIMDGQTIKFPGDFNGDGYTDMITVEKSTDGNGKTARVYLNGRDDSGNVVFNQIRKYPLNKNITWIYVADFDGDGLDDFMFANRERKDEWYLRDIVTLNIFLTRRIAGGGLDFVVHKTPSADYRLASSKRDVLILGDFLGEGKTSFILEISKDNDKEMDVETGGMECDTASQRKDRSYYIRYDKNSQKFVEDKFYAVLGADVYFPADYDGDGKTEILYSSPQNGYTSTAIAKLSFSDGKYEFQEHYNGDPTNWVYCYPGDFNGDGHSDALFQFQRSDPDGEWRVYLFKQNKCQWKNYHCPGIPYLGNGHFSIDSQMFVLHYLKVGDFNGDGCSDILYPNSSSKTIICFGPMRDESELSPFTYRKTINTNGNSWFSNPEVCLGNFKGNECIQLLGNNGSWLYGTSGVIRHIHPISDRYNVESIEDGMSNRVEFEYAYLMPALSGSHADDFFTLNDDQTNLKRYIFSRPMPVKALRKSTVYNSRAHTPSVETRYRYSNVMVHTRGHGILGFTNVTAESYLAGEFKGKTIQRFSTSELGDKCQIVPVSTRVYGPEYNLTQRTEYKYSVCQSRRNAKVFTLLSDHQIGKHYSLDGSYGFEKQTLTKNTYLSDLNSATAYSDIVHCIKTSQCINDKVVDGSAASLPDSYQFRSSVQYQYADEPSSWLVSRPKSVRTIAEGNASEGNADVESLTLYEYKHSSHPSLPSKISVYPSGVHPDSPHFGDDQLATEETFEYNTNGTVKEKRLSAVHDSALPVVTTTYGYSNDGRFLVNVTNTKGYVTRYQYDTDGYGRLVGETDCNDLQTGYSKSPLGTVQTTAFPDQTKSKTERVWTDSGNDPLAPPAAEYKDVSEQLDVNDGVMTMASSYYDAAGRCHRTVRYGLNGEAICTDMDYDKQGRVYGVSEPYFHGTATADIKWTRYGYDAYGRTICTMFPDNTSQEVVYDGLTVETTNRPASSSAMPQTASKTVNVAGWLAESTDPGHNTVKYAYYADGSLKYAQIGNDANTRVGMEYDHAGNRTKLTDPDYGTVVSKFNAYGQTVWNCNPKEVVTSYEYDELGRVILRTETPKTGEPESTIWNYCDTGDEKGLLKTIDHQGGRQTLAYEYDQLKRVSSVAEAFDGSTMTTSYQYEPHTGRLLETTYPTGYTLRRVYGPFGHLQKLTDANGNWLWHTMEADANGQITKYMTGNYVGSTLTYDDDTHRLRRIQTRRLAKNILQDLSYDYDDFGNLAARKDNLRNLEETFTYDHLNRLTDVWLNNVHTGHMAYDALGRMTDKMADRQTVFASAQYETYDQAGRLKPHAMSGATMALHPFPTDNQSIAYTMFDKVATIAQSGNGPQMSLSYTYGHDRQRIRMEEKIGNYTLREKRYGDHCEIVTENRYTMSRTFLSGPMGVFAVVVHNGDSDAIYYVYKDHLGSWTTITNASGVVEREQSFDAWGNLRNPETWSGDYNNTLMFDRGYTGHEHLTEFGLINMNGRCYDPITSSFLSVDAYVQSPDNSQSFNRYAYCQNNPLRYTDPTGWQMIGGNRPRNRFNENWGMNLAEHVVTAQEARQILWNMGISIGTWLMENEMHGGSGGDDGMLGGGSPVYDEHGIFMGTDDGGLQGVAIVMRREDFRIGMKHEDALALAIDLDANDKDAEIRFYTHYSQLCNRPDWDGFVTIEEGIAWAKSHIGASENPTPDNTLYIDAKLLDLGFLTVQNSGLEVGQDFTTVNLYDYVNRKSLRSIHTTYALGNTGIRLLDNEGTIDFRGDKYDWDYHNGGSLRNTLIFFERARTGINDGYGFNVIIYGTTKINKKWPF